MKKIIILSAAVVTSACTQQVPFEQDMSVAHILQGIQSGIGEVVEFSDSIFFQCAMRLVVTFLIAE